jgi:hypothetical protein
MMTIGSLSLKLWLTLKIINKKTGAEKDQLKAQKEPLS